MQKHATVLTYQQKHYVEQRVNHAKMRMHRVRNVGCPYWCWLSDRQPKIFMSQLRNSTPFTLFQVRSTKHLDGQSEIVTWLSVGHLFLLNSKTEYACSKLEVFKSLLQEKVEIFLNMTTEHDLKNKNKEMILLLALYSPKSSLYGQTFGSGIGNFQIRNLLIAVETITILRSIGMNSSI